MQIQDSLYIYIYIIGRNPCQIMVTWEKLLIVRMTLKLYVRNLTSISLEEQYHHNTCLVKYILYSEKQKTKMITRQFKPVTK